MKKFSTKGKLFKYQPYNSYLYNLLLNGEFWMNPPDKLNDPFEGEFRIKDIGKFQNPLFIKKLLKLKRRNDLDDFLFDEQFDNAINSVNYLTNILNVFVNDEVKRKYGVSCFTKNPLNVNMWSHYADSHQGVCLIFNEESLKSIDKNVSLEKINYTNTIPIIEIIDHYADEDADDYIGINEDLNSFLFNKLLPWKEEKEVRMIKNQDFNLFPNRALKFDYASLKGIIFGSRIQYQNIRAIIKLFKTSYQYKNLEFYEAKKNLDRPGIKIEIFDISGLC